MAIDLGMQNPPKISVPVANNRILEIYSGRLNAPNGAPLLKGTGPNWHYEDFNFWVPTWLSQIEQITTSAQLATIYNQETAVNAGWSVEVVRFNTDLVRSNRLIFIQPRLGVRDIDGFIYAIDYQIHVVGLA
ncbi:hypothetical protein O0550_18450 [Brevibacillus halotolerans]|uniref:hypothetical protein n=1 Tax=Brevibacillus TaxID=55080 RepID=UPI00215C7083|nr:MULTISPECIES: hypothetical protein [Brevibacillus]MCR8965157.1 hypothetical protein [Brevibacillus laterosporus]MCZ0837312.1 hypothetical protein [Brevibacillus halotolerans]